MTGPWHRQHPEVYRVCQVEGCCRQGIPRAAADGQQLGRYCMWHFRSEHPDDAPPGPSSPQRASLAPLSARGTLAARLRRDDGLTWREIGQRLGVTGQRAHQLATTAERRSDDCPEAR